MTLKPTLAAVATLGAASLGHAATTHVAPPYPGEASHAEILGEVYGGTFLADGLGFTNGSLVAERIDDAIDQTFVTGVVDASARAIFADHGQSFGYLPGASGGSFVELFSATGYGFGAAGGASATPIEGPFRFARDGAGGILASSRPADNPADADQMVTYRLLNLDTLDEVLVLFFEDERRARSDRDFQDLVVEVRSGEGGILIPSPAAVTAGLAMFGAMASRRRR